MSKGVCIFADSTESNYAKVAARSAKTYMDLPVVIVSNTPEQFKGFNEARVVRVPWVNDGDYISSQDHYWKIGWATPFDETLVVGPRMCLTSSITHWIDSMSHMDLWFCTSYIDHVGKDLVYRQHPVSRCSSNLFYFRQSKIASEFFCTLEQVYRNWKEFYKHHLNAPIPSDFDHDLCFAIAAHLVDHYIGDYKDMDISSMVDMRDVPHSQQPTYITNENDIYVANYKQTSPIFYSDLEIYSKLFC